MDKFAEDFYGKTVVKTYEASVCVDCNYADWKTAHRADDPIYFCAETLNDGFACFGLNAEEAIEVADALYNCVRKLKDVESED